MFEPQSLRVDEEERERLIPYWSVVAACVGFLLVEYYFWFVDPAHRTHLPPMGLRIYLNLSWGLLASLYFLMVGYVSKDAPRRGMSTRFWVVVCLAMPGGIGAVLYFLLRLPEVSCCPTCGTHVQGDFHFCPQCGFQLTASCGNCFETVRATDQFCTRCGHELARDHLPARLHVLSEQG